MTQQEASITFIVNKTNWNSPKTLDNTIRMAYYLIQGEKLNCLLGINIESEQKI